MKHVSSGFYLHSSLILSYLFGPSYIYIFLHYIFFLFFENEGMQTEDVAIQSIVTKSLESLGKCLISKFFIITSEACTRIEYFLNTGLFCVIQEDKIIINKFLLSICSLRINP